MPNLPDPKDVPQSPTPSSEMVKAGSASKEVAERGSTVKGAAGSAAKDAASGKIPTVGSVASSVAKNAAANTETGQKVTSAVDTAVKVKAAAGSTVAVVKGGGAAAGALIVNPVTYIVLAVMLVCSLLWSTLLVIGHNENIDGCVGQQGVDVGQAFVSEQAYGLPEEQKKANAQKVGAWLMSTSLTINGGKPFSREQAAGIIGNMWRESQMNPGAVQGGKLTSKVSNAEIKALNGAYASAVGLLQMTNDRMVKMVETADKMGVHWTDINAQLSFMKTELEADNRGLKAAGFYNPGQSVEDYTRIWNRKYEGSCDIIGNETVGCAESHAGYDPRKAGAERVKYATDAAALLGGGGGVTSGGSCLMGNDFDSSGAAALAISIAYPADQYNLSKVTGGDVMGMNNAPPAYKAAKAKAEKVPGSSDDTYGSPGELYASCDRFVATVTKLTMDPQIPWGATQTQYAYLTQHTEKWKMYSKKSEAQPGDIWVTKGNGHIIMYVGKVKGVDSIAHASFQDRVGAISNASYLNENLVDTGGRAYAGFHFIGTPPAGAGGATQAAGGDTTGG